MFGRLKRREEGISLTLYSNGAAPFENSHGRYWPASSIKLAAAVGALAVLGRVGIDGRSSLRFRDSYGTFRGTLASL
ncbi:MAG: hypothetical protein KAI47_25945, partial [Deltaproteobacteria bacterium]|nr:hypothetical protein [Deltaproteobacteria bacterium]